MNSFLIIIFICIASNLSFGQRKFFVNDTIINEQQCHKITMQKFDPDTVLYSGHPTVDSALINENCIKLVIFYGGGCGKVNCKFLTDGKIMNTSPPQINFTLQFDDADPCEALIWETVRFDISPYKKYAWEKGILFLINNKDFHLLYKIPARE